MVTYKNIRIKMKNGKTRLQRVQVLASGKYKFVKNTGKTKKASSSKRGKSKKSSNKGSSRKMGNKGILGNLGPTGLAEDLAIGYIGTQAVIGMGYPIEQAMPMVRIAQGLAGKALNRRGKGRLAYGIIDLVDVYLIKKGFNLQGISLKAWM